MNIRSLTQLPAVISPTKVTEASNAIKPHDTAERDADGRQPFGEEKKRPVTPEELEKIIENLKKHPGVIANQLIVELVVEESRQFLLIKSSDGQIIRRVPEMDFYQLLDNLDQASGRIYSKAA
ncbi:hypothetical protein K2X05_03215 [bacterium]|jgi:uncharacterized FlaG/YvyC family protein|nr:hypothetical protein [bacterium]